MQQIFASEEETMAFARSLAAVLAAGDLILLHGELGAGKTTFTRGLAAGLNVRGVVASPTFIIAREHQPLSDGPGLIHVDAYRLDSLADLDSLDLDSSLSDSVTVIEWGAGKAEVLSEDRLEIEILRPTSFSSVAELAETDLEDLLSSPRTVVVSGFGDRGRQILAELSKRDEL